MFFCLLQIPPSPLAGPGGLPPNMPPGFPEHGIPPNAQGNYNRQMSNGLPPGPHPMPHGHQPASLMQAGPPEPFQVQLTLRSCEIHRGL